MLKRLVRRCKLWYYRRELKDANETIEWLDTIESGDFTYKLLYIEMKKKQKYIINKIYEISTK